MVNLSLIVTVGLALVARVDATAAAVGGACTGADGCTGTYVAPTTTAAPTTAAAAGNNTNNSNSSSRMLLDEEVLMFEDDVFGSPFDDDVFGEAPARELGAHLMCQCATTTAAPTVQVQRHVVEGKMGIDFGSGRRLEAVDDKDFVALARKLLTVVQVQPHIQAGLQETVHKDTKVTICEKQGTTDMFHVTYEIPCATAADAAAATTKLGDVSTAGAAFDALKAAVKTSAAAASIVLVISGPPTVLVAPTTSVKTVTVLVTTTAAATTAAATTTAAAATNAATPAPAASATTTKATTLAKLAMGALMGLAMLAAAAN